MAQVLVSENITGRAMDSLRSRFEVDFCPDLWRDAAELAQAATAARALIVRNQTQVTASLLGAAKSLEIIGRAGAGLDNIDIDAANAAGVVVSYTPHENAVSVAELTLGLMLSLVRGIPEADRHAKSGGWDRHRFMGGELWQKTLGIVGLGTIGFHVAMRARAFGMHIVATDPFVNPSSASVVETGAELLELDALLAQSDLVTCHLPSNEQTRGLLDYPRLRRMKPSAYLVNIARGEVVDESGLVRALQEGCLAGAALDVRQSEPPEPGPLEAMDRVILTPHLGAFTHEAQQRVVDTVCRDVEAVLSGRAAASFANYARPRRSR